MTIHVDAEYFSQRIMCPREDKKECLPIIRQLLELAYAAQTYGLLAMDAMVQDRNRFPDMFLRKAVGLTVEIADTAERLQTMLDLLKPYGIKEVVRTGTIALQRGEGSITT